MLLIFVHYGRECVFQVVSVLIKSGATIVPCLLAHQSCTHTQSGIKASDANDIIANIRLDHFGSILKHVLLTKIPSQLKVAP